MPVNHEIGRIQPKKVQIKLDNMPPASQDKIIQALIDGKIRAKGFNQKMALIFSILKFSRD